MVPVHLEKIEKIAIQMNYWLPWKIKYVNNSFGEEMMSWTGRPTSWRLGQEQNLNEDRVRGKSPINALEA